MKSWSDFYDPDFYESKIGAGNRVAPEYVQLLSKKTGKILELGCGTGEIVIALAEQGHTVIGLDNSEDMLSRSRLNVSMLDEDIRKRVTFISADFSSFSVEPDLSAIILTNEAAAHVLTPEGLVQTIENCYRSLENGGRIILDIPKLNFRNMANAAGTGKDRLYCRGFYKIGDGDESIRVTEQLHFDESDFIIKTIFCYETIFPDGRLKDTRFRELIQRLWTKQEIAFCLQACGFSGVEIFELESMDDRWFIRAIR